VLQCVAVCCSVLQCVAVCCSVLQCVAVCCSVLCSSVLPLIMSALSMYPSILRCSVLQCVTVCCSVLQCVTSHNVRTVYVPLDPEVQCVVV